MGNEMGDSMEQIQQSLDGHHKGHHNVEINQGLSLSYNELDVGINLILFPLDSCWWFT